MKITVFNGSSWGQEGHTHIVAQLFLSGAVEAGAKVHTVQLSDYDIQPCDRCSSCFYKTPGKCRINDDMHKLAKRFIDSDVAVLAMPLYFDNVSALMKLFIDRLYPLLEPHYEKNSGGMYRRRARFSSSPKLLAISSCVLPEQNNFDVLRLFFRRLARTLHTQLAGEIYLSAAGLILLSEDVRFQKAIKEYKQLVYEAGREFVRSGVISDELRDKLHHTIIDSDRYIVYANEMWDQLLEKHRRYGVMA